MILAPPAVTMAVVNNRLTSVLLLAATVAAIRAVFIRTVVVALKAGQAQHRRRRHLAPVHDLTEHRDSRDTADLGVSDSN